MIKTFTLFFTIFSNLLIFSWSYLGIKLSRLIFSRFFYLVEPFKSNKIINLNLDIFLSQVSNHNKNEIIKNMENYGMTFIEYIFLDKLKKVKII